MTPEPGTGWIGRFGSEALRFVTENPYESDRLAGVVRRRDIGDGNDPLDVALGYEGIDLFIQFRQFVHRLHRLYHHPERLHLEHSVLLLFLAAVTEIFLRLSYTDH